MAKLRTETEMITGKVVLGSEDLFIKVKYDEATGRYKEDEAGQYRCELIIDDEETLKMMKTCAAKAVEEGNTKKLWGKVPKKLSEFEGDLFKEHEEEGIRQGKITINPRTGYNIVVCDAYRNKIINSEQLYPGCIIKAVIDFKGYSVGVSKGVNPYLKGIQKIADGDPIYSGASAEDLFDEEEISDDFLN